MKLVKRKHNYAIGQCENCNKNLKVSFDNIIDPRASSLELKTALQCKCGEYHNLIAEKETQKKPTKTVPATTNNDIVKCDKCNSTQLHSSNKGFGLGKAAVGGVAVGVVGLLGGFIGRKKVLITCMNCGNRWQAGK